MEVRMPPKPETLPRHIYELSAAYCDVVARRFRIKGRTSVGLTNWQIRVQVTTFVNSRGTDNRIRIYFPLSSKRRIVVSLNKTARLEEVWELVKEVQDRARERDVDGFKNALNRLLDYCRDHGPMLFMEYSTERSQILAKPRTLTLA